LAFSCDPRGGQRHQPAAYAENAVGYRATGRNARRQQLCHLTSIIRQRVDMGQKSANQNSGRAGKQGKPSAKPDRLAGEYGKEGTNKTLPEPKADSEPSEELGNTRHIGKSPYTRG